MYHALGFNIHIGTAPDWSTSGPRGSANDRRDDRRDFKRDYRRADENGDPITQHWQAGSRKMEIVITREPPVWDPDDPYDPYKMYNARKDVYDPNPTCDRDDERYRGEQANLEICEEHKITVESMGDDKVCRDIPPVWPSFLETGFPTWIKKAMASDSRLKEVMTSNQLVDSKSSSSSAPLD